MKKIFFAVLPLCMSILLITPAKAEQKPVIAEYFGIWGTQSEWVSKFRNDTPLDKLNRLYVAFAKIIKTKDGYLDINFDDNDNDPTHKHALDLIARTRQINPQAEILITLGGKCLADSFCGAANDPNFAKNVNAFLQKYNWQGLDIDWEQELDKNALNKLVKNLSAELHPDKLLLTLDVWYDVNSAYDPQTLAKYVDQMNIMSYGVYRHLSDIVPKFTDAGFPITPLSLQCCLNI